MSLNDTEPAFGLLLIIIAAWSNWSVCSAVINSRLLFMPQSVCDSVSNPDPLDGDTGVWVMNNDWRVEPEAQTVLQLQ
jgi:hypothetical protein